MKTYLEAFLKECEYEDHDRIFLLEAYEKIVSCDVACALWKKAVEMYGTEGMCDYEAARKLAEEAGDAVGLHTYTTALLLYLCFTKNLRERYLIRNLGLDLYHNTVLDLKYKTEECKLVKGIVGSFVAPWFDGFFKLKRFALGRLQFEVTSFKRNYEKNGKVLTPESRVINVHIPRSGQPLTKEACDRAYAMAKSFFATEIGDVCAFVCSSWLLYPENKHLLSPASNTYRFMSEFEIIESIPDRHGENLWRLFDTDEKNPDRLPTDTSMRRAYVNHLKKGGFLGSGYGVFFA